MNPIGIKKTVFNVSNIEFNAPYIIKIETELNSETFIGSFVKIFDSEMVFKYYTNDGKVECKKVFPHNNITITPCTFKSVMDTIFEGGFDSDLKNKEDK